MRAVVLNPGGRKVTMKRRKSRRRRRRNPLFRARGTGRFSRAGKRLRRKGCGWANNPGKRRRKHRYRARRRNYGGSSIAYNCKMAYNGVGQTFKEVPEVLPIIGGSVLNGMLIGFLSQSVPAISSGPMNLLARFGGAVALGAATKMVSPKYASGVMKGGLINLVTKAVKEYAGLGDYATTRQVANARSIDN